MNEKEKIVYSILLTPILCNKTFSKTTLKDGIIRSPQMYYGCADEDMSDFSIGFYKIVYKDILVDSNGQLIDEKGYPINKEFMGDTMCSFNSLANIILEDTSKNYRSPMEMWQPELVNYYSKYHCLANFWIIPTQHGRRSAKLSKYDSLDFYLEKVKNDFIDDVEGYFGKFISWQKFLEIHCLSGYDLKHEPLKMYKNKDKNSCICELNRIYEIWKLRASELVKKYADELYEYFVEQDVIYGI